MFIENVVQCDDLTPDGVTHFAHVGISIYIQTLRVWETAKRAVEIAIEQDEEAALRYIEEQQKDACL